MAECADRGGIRETYIKAMRRVRESWTGTGEPPLGMYADAVTAVRLAALPEWRCPNCQHVTRARMADHGTLDGGE